MATTTTNTRTLTVDDVIYDIDQARFDAAGTITFTDDLSDAAYDYLIGNYDLFVDDAGHYYAII